MVVSNRRLNGRKFESYYSLRWQVESEVFKSLGLESYIVRRLKAVKCG
ncbi:hypothetical protein [Hydrogenivirga sp.]